MVQESLNPPRLRPAHGDGLLRDSYDSARPNADRYVARSRAKHLLTVIEAQEE